MFEYFNEFVYEMGHKILMHCSCSFPAISPLRISSIESRAVEPARDEKIFH